MQISSNIHFLLETQVQFKILHWQTKAFSRHLAFGGIYDALDDLIDKYVEVAMGKYGRPVLKDNEKTINLVNLSEMKLNPFMKGIQTELSKWTSDLDEKDTDLLNIRDEILGEINKLSYLLTLE